MSKVNPVIWFDLKRHWITENIRSVYGQIFSCMLPNLVQVLSTTCRCYVVIPILFPNVLHRWYALDVEQYLLTIFMKSPSQSGHFKSSRFAVLIAHVRSELCCQFVRMLACRVRHLLLIFF